MRKNIAIQSLEFDQNRELEKIHAKDKSIGAIVSFIGYCRDENGALTALEIEHYPDMAQKQLHHIVDEAARRWQLNGATLIHRFGKIKVGEQIVLVITTSSHRNAAFEAANFIMDHLKTDAPFWKKEHLQNGEARDWVSAKTEDKQKKQNWTMF